LTGFGFRAVISTSFADIFRQQFPQKRPAADHRGCEEATRICSICLKEIPTAELSVDLASQSLSLPDGRKVTFPIDTFAKSCLLNGVDELGYIAGFEKEIAAYEAQH